MSSSLASTDPQFVFGPFRLDARKRVLWRGSDVVSLPPKAVSLLSTLAGAAGDVVAKDELMAQVWPDTIVEDSNLTVTMSALRRALGRRGDGRPYIETLSRRGYRLLLPPKEADGLVPRDVHVLGRGASRPARNGAAWQSFARGAHFWHRLSPPNLYKAVACFEEALLHDPRYALAHAGRASAYLALAATGGLAPRCALPLAAEAADRAVAEDKRLPIAYVVRGYVKALAQWDWPGAEADMRRALELDPRSLNARLFYALLLACLGRSDEAALHAERALDLDPVSLVGHCLRGLLCALRGDHEGALEAYAKATELSPDHFLGHWGCGVSRVRLGRREEGLRDLRRTCDLAGGSVVLRAFLAFGLARAERTGEARSLLDGLEATQERRYVSPYQRATVHAALGDRDAALELIESAARDHDPWLALLCVDPRLEPLRDDPRWFGLLSQVFPAVPEAPTAGGVAPLPEAKRIPTC